MEVKSLRRQRGIGWDEELLACVTEETKTPTAKVNIAQDTAFGNNSTLSTVKKSRKKKHWKGKKKQNGRFGIDARTRTHNVGFRNFERVSALWRWNAKPIYGMRSLR